MSGMMTALCVLLAVNGVLLHQAWRYWHEYKASQEWPRMETTADEADIQRVEFVQQSQPGTNTHYEVALRYRYRVGGVEYAGHTKRHVGTREEAENLKGIGRVVFFYNPADPAETLEAIAMPVKLKIIGFLLLAVNAAGIWQLAVLYGRGQG